ncbi:hypothetical protein [Variovorax boronicumulans]|uniref:hypothetical protein n=1 Tax=Variovorax boronicumulans TaxID=436515 RepID=UPI00278363DA|nr:hypothetical protein [Variovorax boronicumulans]MDQ0040835.1 hypothetical protein [Variovorax boronicumulans]
MSLNTHDAYKTAVELIKAGLQGEGLKLKGCASSGTASSAQTQGSIDAAYLDTLIKGLVKTLTA